MKGKGFGTVISIILLLMFIIGAFAPMLSSGQGEAGFLSGSVYDSKTQDPIVNAAVFIGGNESVWYTNEEGVFVIPDLEFGSYKLTVYAKGYNLTTINVDHRINGTSVKVPMDREFASPHTTGFITGNVYLEALLHGHDAGDAIVYVESPIGGSAPVMVDVSVSADDPLVGNYVVELPPGDYDLSAWAYSHHVAHSGPVTVTAGSVRHVDFHLETVDMHNSGLAGNVTDSVTSDPVEGATVIAYNLDEGLSYFTVTDSDGFYFFTGPWEGDYIVVAIAAGYDPGSATGHVNWGAATYVDIALHPNSTVVNNCSVLWGFVFGDGYPYLNGQVFTDYGLVMTTDFMGIPGMYYINCFPPGVPHNVGAWIPGFYPVVHTLTVPYSTVMRHDFYLQSIYNVTSKWSLVVGNVYIEGTTSALNGAEVHLDGSTFSGTYACPASSNFFWFELVPPGAGYQFNPVKAGFTYTGYSIDGGTEQPPSASFSVPSHSLVEADLFMERGTPGENTTIWGYVYMNYVGGPVLPGITVKLLIPTGSPAETTTSLGYYSFSVSPGLHSVTILMIGYYDIYYMDHLTGATGPIPWMGTVASGTSRHVDFIVRQKEPVKNCSVVAGQVIDISTGNPVDNYEVKIYPAAAYPSFTTLSGSMMAGTGMFMFGPLCWYVPGTWFIDGYDTTFIYDFDHLEYHALPSGSSTTSSTMYTTYTLPSGTILWFDIYVNKTQEVRNTTIWGYLYLDGLTGPVIPGETIKIILPAGGPETDTDSFGRYLFHVSPGSFEVSPVMIYPASVAFYDHATGTYGTAPWTGSVALGDSRHVDFIVKKHEATRNASAIAGIVLRTDDHTPVSGFYVKAYPELHPGDYPSLFMYTNTAGMFHFGPLYLDLDESWLFSGDDPSYVLDHVEYHLLPSGTVTTETSMPIFFDLPDTSIMWVEIYVNETQVCNGTVFGKVYKLYSYHAAEWAQASIFDLSDPYTAVDTQTLGPDGLYTFTVPAGSYRIRISLVGYHTETADVSVTCGEETYHPFYLLPFLIERWDEVRIRFLNNETGEPITGYDVEVSGMGHMKTDEGGNIRFKLPYPTNLTVSLKSFVVVISTDDDDDEELSMNDDGSYTFEPGRNYTMRVTKFRPGSELSNTVKSAEASDVTVIGAVGIAAVALIVGIGIGYVMKKTPADQIEE